MTLTPQPPETPFPPHPRPIDRMVLFSDAVVAIAITLLILPLVDLASEHDVTVGSLFRGYSGQLVACGVSFVVLAQYWVNHHDLFGRIDRQTPSILWLNRLWLATILFLPLPTEMLANDPHGDRTAKPSTSVRYSPRASRSRCSHCWSSGSHAPTVGSSASRS